MEKQKKEKGMAREQCRRKRLEKERESESDCLQSGWLSNGYNYAARNRGHKVFGFISIKHVEIHTKESPPQGIIIVFLCQEQGEEKRGRERDRERDTRSISLMELEGDQFSVAFRHHPGHPVSPSLSDLVALRF